MSDRTDDRRHRGGRGSLLDHARDAGKAPAEQAMDTRQPGRPATGATQSILSASNRSARVSTSRYDSRHAASPQTSTPVLADPSPERLSSPEPVSRPASEPAQTGASGREKFGDRISRLIGKMAPDDKPEPLHAQAGEKRSSEPETMHRTSPEPDYSSRKPAQQAQPAEPEPSHDPHPGTDRYARDDQQTHDDHYHWHAAAGDGRFANDTRPLLDASILISTVWRFRRIIAVTTVAGAVLGVLMALSTPHKYYAESRLFVDPREIRVTEDDIRNQQLSTEAMLAITDSQLQILSSTSVLEKVVEDLGLDRDPEFNGSLPSGGIGGGLSLIKQIFTGKNAAAEGEQKALNNLREALSVFRDAKTFVIIVGVDTRDAEKSALIANQIVETYLDSEGQAQSNLLERTSESIDTRINSLRADLDAAEREVERFKAENGLVGVGGQYIDDKVILALSDQLGNARAMKVGIRVKAENLAKVKINDVLSGAFPEELLSTNLSELRKQYTQTKSNAESLATRLGPRHPQYIAAMQSLETITNEISAELRRIVASSQTELQRAVETEQELASQMAIAKSRAMDQSVELVGLRELERKANATRGIYEAFLTRSRETSERSNLSTRNVRVISPAEPPIQPTGPSRKIIAIGGMMAGFFAGLGLALLFGAIESIRTYNSAHTQDRYPGSPFGGYPQPPVPDPGTPSGGPGRKSRPRTDNGTFRGRDSVAGQPAPSPYSGARAEKTTAPAEMSSIQPEPTGLEPQVAVADHAPSASVRTGFFRRKVTSPQPPVEPSAPVRSSQSVPPAPAVRSEKVAATQAPDPVWLQAETDGRAAEDVRVRPQAVYAAQASSPGQTSWTQDADKQVPAGLAPDFRPEQQVWHPQPAQPTAQAATPYQPHFSQQAQPSLQVAAHVPAPAQMQPFYPHPASYYPAPQPQPQPPLQPQPQLQTPSYPMQHYPSIPGHVVDPYAPGHPGYPALAGHHAAAPVYAAPQFQMMPPQPHMVSPQTYPAYAPQQPPMPPQVQPYPEVPQHPVHQQPAPASAHVPPAPVAQAIPAAEPVRSAPPEPPVSTEQVDRIRREMDQLRSRIDGYSAHRRSA